MASYARWAGDDTGAVACKSPILLMSSASPRLEAGICASGCAAILLLLSGMGFFFACGRCPGGVLISGERDFCWTSPTKHASRLAASFGVGVASRQLACATVSPAFAAMTVGLGVLLWSATRAAS